MFNPDSLVFCENAVVTTFSQKTYKQRIAPIA